MTNTLEVDKAPAWLTENMVYRPAAKVESRLEWSTTRVKGFFYKSTADFENLHGFRNSPILAFYRQSTRDIHFGPLINKSNFEEIFAHELAHAIVAQKYQGHLPKWLEEGLANWSAGKNDVDWIELSKLASRMDPVDAGHPFLAKELAETQSRYLVSLATLLYLKKQCPSFRELLNLSLKSKLEDYLPTYCQIKDLKADFWNYVDRKAKLVKRTRGL